MDIHFRYSLHVYTSITLYKYPTVREQHKKETAEAGRPKENKEIPGIGPSKPLEAIHEISH